jgi:hypothetical protein
MAKNNEFVKKLILEQCLVFGALLKYFWRIVVLR